MYDITPSTPLEHWMKSQKNEKIRYFVLSAMYISGRLILSDILSDPSDSPCFILGKSPNALQGQIIDNCACITQHICGFVVDESYGRKYLTALRKLIL
jgi:hypothetical protein